MGSFLLWIKTASRRLFLNFIGRYRQAGACPNCSDRWNWKTPQVIHFHSAVIGQSIGFRAVTICSECASQPRRIHLREIERNLIRQQWSVKDAQLAIQAIDNTFEEPLSA